MKNSLERVSIRLVEEPPLLSKDPINNPEAAIHVLGSWLEQMDRELFCIINLRTDLRPINMNIVSVGALNYAQVHPREVMKSAILSNAASIMVVHNHPSGNLTPSKEDILLTDRLQQVGDLLRIPLMDHIITGKNYEYYSIREQMDYRASPAELTDDANSLKWTQTMVAEEQFYQDSSNAEETKQKKLDEIMEGLERGVNDILSSENYKKYLKFLSSFHQYSLNNTILIYKQKPNASLVAGYRKWQTMGRQVKKGEKGIRILAPIPVKVKAERVKRDPITKEIIKSEDGEPIKEEAESTIPKFKISTVFDIEQTDGEPIPQIEVFDLTGHVKEFFTFMDAVMKISPVSIRYDEIKSGAKGYYHLEQNEIVIRRGMSESQTMKTAIHECAHAILHNRDKMQEGNKDRQTKEVEAESVAYIVCNYFGLDTSDYSFPYIATWGSGREMKELKDSLNLIKQTAGTFIEQLSEKIEEIKKDQYYYIADDTRGGHLALSTYDDLQEGLDVYFSMRSTTKTFEMVIDGMSGDNVTLLANINGEDRVNSELIEMDSVGRKLESTLEIIQKEVDRHNAIVEKDVKLSFYAAECDDFPILGEYHENIETFEEAIKIYENLKKDRFLGDEGIGFKLTVNGKYKGRFTLIQGANRLIGLEKEGSFMDHPMINQAVDKAKRYVKSFEKSEMIQATAKRNTTKIACK